MGASPLALVRLVVLLGLLDELGQGGLPLGRVAELGHELASQLIYGARALRSRRGERPDERVLDVEVKVRGILPDARAAPDLLQRSPCARGDEGILSREGLPKHGSEAKDVGPLVHEHALDLLGRHIAHGAAARPAVAGRRAELGHAEVGDLHRAHAVDHDVRRLDVHVQDAVLVRIGERAGARREDVRALLVGEPAALHAGKELGEVQAVDVLHDQVGVAGVQLEVDHAHDVGVGEQAGCARLGEDLVDGRGTDAVGAVVHERHALDGDASLQARVPAGAHGAEAARPASSQDAVAAQEQVLGLLRLVHASGYERR